MPFTLDEDTVGGHAIAHHLAALPRDRALDAVLAATTLDDLGGLPPAERG